MSFASWSVFSKAGRIWKHHALSPVIQPTFSPDLLADVLAHPIENHCLSSLFHRLEGHRPQTLVVKLCIFKGQRCRVSSCDLRGFSPKVNQCIVYQHCCSLMVIILQVTILGCGNAIIPNTRSKNIEHRQHAGTTRTSPMPPYGTMHNDQNIAHSGIECCEFEALRCWLILQKALLHWQRLAWAPFRGKNWRRAR